LGRFRSFLRRTRPRQTCSAQSCHCAMQAIYTARTAIAPFNPTLQLFSIVQFVVMDRELSSTDSRSVAASIDHDRADISPPTSRTASPQSSWRNSQPDRLSTRRLSGDALPHDPQQQLLSDEVSESRSKPPEVDPRDYTSAALTPSDLQKAPPTSWIQQSRTHVIILTFYILGGTASLRRIWFTY
jgi:hypothetical protein